MSLRFTEDEISTIHDELADKAETTAWIYYGREEMVPELKDMQAIVKKIEDYWDEQKRGHDEKA